MPYQPYSDEDLHSRVLKYTPNCKHIKHLTESSEIKNLAKTIVYLQLTNNDEFWFYIDSFTESTMHGFRRVNHRWMYYSVEVNQVSSYY